MSSGFTTAEPQVAPVPARLAEGVVYSLSGLNTGSLMQCNVSVSKREGLIGLRVYAYESDVDALDMSTLRLHGLPCTATEWVQKPPSEGLFGPILSPVFGVDGGTVDLEEYLPRFITRFTPRRPL